MNKDLEAVAAAIHQLIDSKKCWDDRCEWAELRDALKNESREIAIAALLADTVRDEVIDLLELCKMAGWRYTCSPAFFMRIDHILARLNAQTEE